MYDAIWLASRLRRITSKTNLSDVKILRLQWSRCQIHPNDMERAFSLLQTKNFARRQELCPQAEADSNVATTSCQMMPYSSRARGCSQASDKDLLFAPVQWCFSLIKLVLSRDHLYSGKSPNAKLYIIRFSTMNQHTLQIF